MINTFYYSFLNLKYFLFFSFLYIFWVSAIYFDTGLRLVVNAILLFHRPKTVSVQEQSVLYQSHIGKHPLDYNLVNYQRHYHWAQRNLISYQTSYYLGSKCNTGTQALAVCQAINRMFQRGYNYSTPTSLSISHEYVKANYVTY